MKKPAKRAKFMELRNVRKSISEIRHLLTFEDTADTLEEQLHEEKMRERLEGKLDVYQEWEKVIEKDLEARGVDIPDDLGEWLNDNPTDPRHKETTQ